MKKIFFKTKIRMTFFYILKVFNVWLILKARFLQVLLLSVHWNMLFWLKYMKNIIKPIPCPYFFKAIASFHSFFARKCLPGRYPSVCRASKRGVSWKKGLVLKTKKSAKSFSLRYPLMHYKCFFFYQIEYVFRVEIY